MARIQFVPLRSNELAALRDLIISIKPVGDRMTNNKTLLLRMVEDRLQNPDRYTKPMALNEARMFQQYQEGPKQLLKPGKMELESGK